LRGRMVSGGWVNAFNALAIAKKGSRSLSRKYSR
jgi:hypothetical protein